MQLLSLGVALAFVVLGFIIFSFISVWLKAQSSGAPVSLWNLDKAEGWERTLR